MEFSYMKVTKEDDFIAIIAMEKGTENEILTVNYFLNIDCKLEKSTKEEYEAFDGEEEEISK